MRQEMRADDPLSRAVDDHPAELGGSGRHRMVVVVAPFGRERIDDPRQLIGDVRRRLGLFTF
jgi:hypothetical protein